MKKFLYNFFILCAGSDKEILANCPTSERTKHVGFGMLLFIPTLMGFATMSYALSTVIDSKYLYYTVAVFWMSIIFIIDRFIVSTFRKSNYIGKGDISEARVNIINLFSDLVSFKFISRLIIAGFIGIAVAHPFVLYYFRKKIDEKLNYNFVLSQDSIISKYSKNSQYYGLILKKEEERDCIARLLGSEQIKVRVYLDCGESSGEPGFGTKAKGIQKRLITANEELRSLRVKDSLWHLEQDKLKEKGLLEDSIYFSRDYLAREGALEELESDPNGNGHVKNTRRFIILCILLLDVLVVFLKATTKRGPYDDEISLREMKSKNEMIEDVLVSNTKLSEERSKLEMQLNVQKETNLAYERANSQFMATHGGKLFERVIYLRQSYETAVSIINERASREKEFMKRIFNEEKEFQKAYGHRLGELFAMALDDPLRESFIEDLEKLKESFSRTIVLIFEEHINVK